jgi:hypothetical protein
MHVELSVWNELTLITGRRPYDNCGMFPNAESVDKTRHASFPLTAPPVYSRLTNDFYSDK